MSKTDFILFKYMIAYMYNVGYMLSELHDLTSFNYSPKWRWLAVDIYRAAERRGKL